MTGAWAPVAVVTGAASGIGRATAELVLERGGSVVVVDLTKEGLAWADGVDRVVAVAGDVSEEGLNREAVAAAEEAFGRLDLSVLNAGVVGNPPLEADDALDRWEQVVAVNVRGVLSGVRAALPALRRAGGGAIVATASTSGIRADPGMWSYNATKAAVINLVRSLSLDHAAEGIRVNAVCPGPTRSGMTAPLEAGAPEVFESLRQRVPMQRWGESRELAEAIWFLGSPAASFITGVALPVDGGVSANTGQFLPTEGRAR